MSQSSRKIQFYIICISFHISQNFPEIRCSKIMFDM